MNKYEQRAHMDSNNDKGPNLESCVDRNTVQDFIYMTDISSTSVQVTL